MSGDPWPAAANDAESLRLLIQSTVDYAIFTLDTEGRVANWNAGARRLKGYETAEIVGQHFRVFYTPDAQATGHPEEELALATAEGRYEEEGWRVRKDGSRFWANVVITALRDPDGNLRGFGKVTRDLTERKRAEDELVRRERLAAVGELAAAVAHELGNRIAVVTNAHYLLRRLWDSGHGADMQRPLSIAEASLASTTLVIADLLDFAEARTPLPVPVDLDEVIAEALTTTAPPDNVAFQRTESSGVSLRVDRAQLRQVLVNLFANGYEAMPDGGSLTVSVDIDDDLVRIAVTDTGSGMDDATLASAVDPLFTTKARGLGLGLAAAARIARAHEGKLGLESTPGHGSTVIVELPLAGPSDQPGG